MKAINHALHGVKGTTALHMCFGYAHIVHQRADGYSFLRELEDLIVDVISIEAAQPKLDLAIVKELPTKSFMIGVLDLGDANVETPELVADRIRRALDVLPAERLIVAPDCGMKYLARDVAFGKLSAMVAGAALVRREL